MSITGASGERIALYLDESMTNGETWNPVAASETGGFYEIEDPAFQLPTSLSFQEAQDAVGVMNASCLALTKEQASEIVLASFRNQNTGA